MSYNLSSGSMEGVLLVGDRVFVNRLAYVFKDPKREDIVVLLPPHEREKNFIKRIVALEGDTVEVEYLRSDTIKRKKIKLIEINNR